MVISHHLVTNCHITNKNCVDKILMNPVAVITFASILSPVILPYILLCVWFTMSKPNDVLLYSRNVWQGGNLVNLFFLNVWKTRSAKRLLIVISNLVDFSLVNHGWLPNLPNFPTANCSCYTVYVMYINLIFDLLTDIMRLT